MHIAMLMMKKIFITDFTYLINNVNYVQQQHGTCRKEYKKEC